MTKSVCKGFVYALLLAVVGACSSGPPSISEIKVGKTKDVAEATTSFGAHDTIFAVAKLENPPKNGKVSGQLIVVNVEGQQAGPIPGLATSMDLAGGMNVANFDFTAPTAGWPNGEYQLEVVVHDDKGAEVAKKSVNFSTSGNAPAAPPADATATDTSATDTTATDTDTASTEEQTDSQQ